MTRANARKIVTDYRQALTSSSPQAPPWAQEAMGAVGLKPRGHFYFAQRGHFHFAMTVSLGATVIRDVRPGKRVTGSLAMEHRKMLRLMATAEDRRE